jgi:lipopolysaccharide/colanic/teichoic acid biosynthesis glycosyltransferase
MVWYVDNRSLWLDLRILLVTAAKVLKRDGITSDGHATAPELTGSERAF